VRGSKFNSHAEAADLGFQPQGLGIQKGIDVQSAHRVMFFLERFQDSWTKFHGTSFQVKSVTLGILPMVSMSGCHVIILLCGVVGKLPGLGLESLHGLDNRASCGL
jgi:hypothetical protein